MLGCSNACIVCAVRESSSGGAAASSFSATVAFLPDGGAVDFCLLVLLLLLAALLRVGLDRILGRSVLDGFGGRGERASRECEEELASEFRRDFGVPEEFILSS